MVGDPSGKSDMRKMLTQEEIAVNGAAFQKQMHNLVSFGEGKARMMNNADWLLKLNYVSFLRDVGVHFSVNRMLTADCFKSRLEKGLSFIEFNYMLMQGYDFLKLFEDFDCRLQLGGDDQWSNILAGADLIRRVHQQEAYGMTFTLLTTSEGKKMGKTENGAVWLDPDKTSPYDFYQYWRNVADADVARCLKLLTFLPMDSIADLLQPNANINETKAVLAYEVTAIVHGADEAQKAQDAAKALFAGGTVSEDMPTVHLTASLLAEGYPILSLLTDSALLPSKGEARRMVSGGGVSVNGGKVASVDQRYGAEDLQDNALVIKQGKKKYLRVLFDA